MQPDKWDFWFTPIFGRKYAEPGKTPESSNERERHLSHGRCLIISIEKFRSCKFADRNRFYKTVLVRIYE
jgi:hypothetical protein